MQRLSWIDTSKVFSSLGVIVIHSSAMYLLSQDHFGQSIWNQANLYNSFARSLIPLFFMASGHINLPRSKNPTFVLRRLIKILFPWFFWSVIFGWFINPQNPLSGFSRAWSTNFWFFKAITICYLASYLLSNLITRLPRIYLWLISGLLLLSPYHLVRYLSYFLLGGAISRSPTSNPLKPLTIYILASLVTFLLTSYQSNINGEFTGIYYEYWSINVFIATIGLFYFFRSVKSHPALFATISSATLGIYILNTPIIQFIGFSLPLEIAIFSSFFITLSLVLILKRSPILKHSV